MLLHSDVLSYGEYWEQTGSVTTFPQKSLHPPALPGPWSPVISIKPHPSLARIDATPQHPRASPSPASWDAGQGGMDTAGEQKPAWETPLSQTWSVLCGRNGVSTWSKIIKYPKKILLEQHENLALLQAVAGPLRSPGCC